MLPAICDQCGAVFSSGFAIENSTRVSMVGCGAGPCPSCGGSGTIPDGLYDAFGDTLRILADGPRSARSLEHLADVLRNAQRQGMDREATAVAIETEVPEFAALASDIRQRHGWTLNQWLMFLLALIAVLVTSGEAISNTLSQPAKSSTCSRSSSRPTRSSRLHLRRSPPRSRRRHLGRRCGRTSFVLAVAGNGTAGVMVGHDKWRRRSNLTISGNCRMSASSSADWRREPKRSAGGSSTRCGVARTCSAKEPLSLRRTPAEAARSQDGVRFSSR